jgi:hypothetical protein
MPDVEDVPQICHKERCPKGGIIDRDEPYTTIEGKTYHVECAPTPRENESYT